MTKFASFVAVVLFAACGGKSAPKQTAVQEENREMKGAGSASGSSDGHADNDHEHAAGSAATPPTPAPPPPDQGPTASQPDPAKVKADLLVAEQAAFESAKPVFEKHCARCHTEGGKLATQKKLGHFDMTKYPFGGHHSATMAAEIRKTLGLTGEKPTMPKDKKGAVKGDELALIAAWADAFDKSRAGGAPESAGHGDEQGEKHHH